MINVGKYCEEKTESLISIFYYENKTNTNYDNLCVK